MASAASGVPASGSSAVAGASGAPGKMTFSVIFLIRLIHILRYDSLTLSTSSGKTGLRAYLLTSQRYMWVKSQVTKVTNDDVLVLMEYIWNV